MKETLKKAVKHRVSYAALLLVLGACGENKEKLTQLPPVEKAREQTEAVAVATTTVHKADVARMILATGTTEPVRAADLGPQMTARVNAVLVDEGDVVKAGQPLVRLDVVAAELRVEQSAAQVASTETQYELAKKEYERLQPLAARGTVTAQQLERLASQRDALKSAADAARVAQQDAAHTVTNAIVRAPFAGIVSRVLVEVGEVATMAPVKVLVRLVDLSSVDVRVRVHERELARIGVGAKVRAHFPASDETLEGEVHFISPEIDPRTRSAEVVTRFANEGGKLRAGMFAEIMVTPEHVQESLVVPSSAVAGTGDDRYTFVINNGLAQKRPVRVSPVDDKTFEVLEGHAAGDVIVLEGVGRLSDGAKVRIGSLGAAETKPERAP